MRCQTVEVLPPAVRLTFSIFNSSSLTVQFGPAEPDDLVLEDAALNKIDKLVWLDHRVSSEIGQRPMGGRPVFRRCGLQTVVGCNLRIAGDNLNRKSPLSVMISRPFGSLPSMLSALLPVASQQQMIAGATEVELVPQGTLIERIRAGGFGLGGILTRTGVGTVVEEGKRRIDVEGKSYLLETALRADFALVHAFLADYSGNLSYALTARNFNPVIAMAGDTVIVTAEHIVPIGVITPDHVVTPAPLVDYLVANT